MASFPEGILPWVLKYLQGEGKGDASRGLVNVACNSMHVISICLVACAILRRFGPRWCRKKEEDVSATGVTVEAAALAASGIGLRRKKELKTAYTLWLVAGLLGAHHLYLDRPAHGIAACWSLNFGFCGWVVDAMLMRRYVGQANGAAALEAPHDESFRRLVARAVPLLILSWVLMGVVGAASPRALHQAGLVDLDDSLAAQMVRRPHSVIASSPGATLSQSKQQYKAKLSQIRKERGRSGCDERCATRRIEVVEEAWVRVKTFHENQETRKQEKPKGASATDWDVLLRTLRELLRDWRSSFELASSSSRSSSPGGWHDEF